MTKEEKELLIMNHACTLANSDLLVEILCTLNNKTDNNTEKWKLDDKIKMYKEKIEKEFLK